MTNRFPLLLTLFLCFTASAQVNIHVVNPGFEIDELFCTASNDCAQYAVTGWMVGPASGFYKPGTAQFAGGAPGGSNVAFIGGDELSSSATGSISQTLIATLTPNTTYTLKFSIGSRADYPITGYLAALTVGGVPVATDNTVLPAPGTFLQDTVVYKSGPSPLLIGQPLGIFIKSVGHGQVDVDDVALTAQAE